MYIDSGDNTMSGKKVLVVDDEIHIVHVVAIKLRNNGFEVITAGNGEDAFELACKNELDVVITDFQMPIMTGLELVEKLRQYEPTSHLPVIMLTARGFAIDDEEKERLGIATFISKPFSPRELLGCVEDVIHLSAVT
jgi:two-component system alkaline phosphatase synthesis response regulator PhoP